MRREHIVVFIAAVIGIVALTYPAQGWFHWVDDHHLAEWVFLGRPFSVGFFAESDRFRPMFHILRIGVYYNLFGDQIAFWRLWFVAHNALWMTLFYAVLRRLNIGVLLSALALPLLLWYPQSLTVTYRFGTVEGMGNVFLLAAVLALLANRHWSMVVLALLAGACKESFALILPVFALWYATRPTRRSRPLYALVFGTVALLALVLRARLSAGGYGEMIGGFSTEALVYNTHILLIALGFSVPMLMGALTARSLGGIVLVAAGVGSQIVAHSSIGIAGHYQYPVILVTVGATVLSLHVLRRQRRLLAVCTLALALSLANRFVSPLATATAWGAEGEAFHAEMQRTVEQNPPTFELNDELIEWNVSAASWLDYYGWRGQFIVGENACCLTPEILRVK
ncbi:MAG: hypothetical protein IAE80_19800 [Anaerolinea sp.]|nr:hypothetical protein [Anaerolinea sp.]